MLSETKLSLLQQLVQNASKEEIIWTKGYLTGFLDQNLIATSNPTIVESQAVSVKPLIIYGTETGNSKKVASQLLANFKKNKIQAKSVDVFQFDASKLEKETLVLFVMSTQGEGEFPQNAVAFYENLNAADVNLNKVSYAVLGLGDTSYPLFCNAGVLLDEVLTEKGAQRLLPLVKADVDFAETVSLWESDLQKVFQNQGSSEVVSKTTATASTKKNYTGRISHKVVLNDKGSNKETYHIEIESDDVIAYEPGDALGVFPKNKESEIKAIADYFDEDNYSILSDKNIKGLSKKSLDALSKVLDITIDEDKTDLLDVITKYQPKKVKLEEIVALLHPIAPRLYSISSSSEAHDGQVHLTVNLNIFKVGDEIKSGLASQFLADFPLETELEFYIHKNQNFRLPSEDTDLIMIGPGTGIAPFRSFLAHRDATGAEGKNWLFFGEQHFVLDFYYQTEIQEWITTGVLSKLDTAFSRDQERKIYVQDRIREKAKEFNAWIENGASIYICGQKNPMSQDVEQTILEVIASERNITIEAAGLVLEELENKGKYQKDVY
ncbi:MAG: flavodoxin domain-containing protein [Flavobacterium sp.]|jgi:sulfite reductase (NADPH) flavoprotein alpha-component|uniref:diflavin oxidoreductase n=1 Tax=Flavobacterium sp. TaxID=239 RepID=UPI0022BC630F|nr:flavodoxin domain-containing protein [Flavobacterium sp.]MCZ8089948.1 flavodoxin domain-containing protein [Flavobacterium sp.]MCZ8331149.1 flavodoxin domain-containing protein [Flavobacterium sp.]